MAEFTINYIIDRINYYETIGDYKKVAYWMNKYKKKVR